MFRLVLFAAALAAAVYILLRRRRGPGDADAGEPPARAWPDDRGNLESEGPRRDEDAPAPFADDATLVARVESQLFRDPELPKGQINIDAAGGVVTLRGQAPPELIEELAVRTAVVEGVVRVENRLHPPGEGAGDAGEG